MRIWQTRVAMTHNVQKYKVINFFRRKYVLNSVGFAGACGFLTVIEVTKIPENEKEWRNAIAELNDLSECQMCGNCCNSLPRFLPGEKVLLSDILNKIIYPCPEDHCPFLQNKKCFIQVNYGISTKPLECRAFICTPKIKGYSMWFRKFSYYFFNSEK